MELLMDGTIVATQTGGSISWFWNAVASTDGNHTIKLKATDSRGNPTEDSRQVIVSLAPPSMPGDHGTCRVPDSPDLSCQRIGYGAALYDGDP